MPITLTNIRDILLTVFGAGIFIIYFTMKLEIGHLESELKESKEKQTQLATLLSAQNDAVVKWQEAAFVKDKQLMIIQKRIDADRKKAAQSTLEMMKVKIPGGSNGAIHWLIQQAQTGKT